MAGEDRSSGNAKAIAAALTLELATFLNFVGLIAAATRANGFPARLRPAELAKRLVCRVFTCPENLGQ